MPVAGMLNAIVRVQFSLDLPESVIESIVSPGADRVRALEEIERAVAEEPFRFADHMTAGEPEVEADG